MEANRRQLVLLGAILVLLASVLYWQSTGTEVTPEEFSAAMRQSAPGAAGALDATPAPAARPRPAAGPAVIPAVGLASLDRAQPEPADSGRDPFRFGSAPAAVPRGGSTGGGFGGAAPAVPAPPQEPAGPPPIPLRFIGIARQGEGRMYAVLRDERGVYYGAEGDVVEGRYRILRVSTDTVELSYVDGRGRVTIPMSGGRP
ncbi:MAG TPA: hypothetical protein VLN08_05920 [Vicinamibacterales bacterium]|nr:hypothetical protein [Vicinamibacterales bacterium]